MGVFARPTTSTGWRSWVTTVDHKKIAIMYGAASLFFFVIGGIEAILIRLQLAAPDGQVLSADLHLFDPASGHAIAHGVALA